MKSEAPADFAFTVPVGGGRRPWLRQTLKSLASQSATVSVAICAVEDSEDLQTALTEFSDIINYVRIGPDDGQSDAINEGWDALEAAYYGWLNDDDMLHPDAIVRALVLFKAGADVVHGRSDILIDGQLNQGYGDRPITAHLLDDNTIAQPSTFVRRAALDAVAAAGPNDGRRPLYVDHHYAMDWDLWRRLYKADATFIETPETLSITRWYEGTKTSAHSVAKYSEYYRLLRSDRRRLRAAWTVGNTILNNLALYGPAKPVFAPFHRVLHAVHARKSHPVDVKEGVASTRNVSQKVEAFHFADEPQKVGGDEGDAQHMLLPGHSIVLDQASVRVGFD